MGDRHHRDRKSTRLNSSHANISYAVFCLKKKKKPSLHSPLRGKILQLTNRKISFRPKMFPRSIVMALAESSVMGIFKYFFFFNDTATTEIYTLSLHDALPISSSARGSRRSPQRQTGRSTCRAGARKSTRLNSSHANISYAVFCLKKKKSN